MEGEDDRYLFRSNRPDDEKAERRLPRFAWDLVVRDGDDRGVGHRWRRERREEWTDALRGRHGEVESREEAQEGPELGWGSVSADRERARGWRTSALASGNLASRSSGDMAGSCGWVKVGRETRRALPPDPVAARLQMKGRGGAPQNRPG